jgi:hypothetical protein
MPTTPTRPKRFHGLPYVDDATLVEMSGKRALNQHELWENVGKAQTGKLSAWVLVESYRLAQAGMTPQDAALYMAGYVVTALSKQGERDQAVAELQSLLNASSAIPEATD